MMIILKRGARSAKTHTAAQLAMPIAGRAASRLATHRRWLIGAAATATSSAGVGAVKKAQMGELRAIAVHACVQLNSELMQRAHTLHCTGCTVDPVTLSPWLPCRSAHACSSVRAVHCGQCAWWISDVPNDRASNSRDLLRKNACCLTPCTQCHSCSRRPPTNAL
jgi:hypothetical protein